MFWSHVGSSGRLGGCSRCLGLLDGLPRYILLHLRYTRYRCSHSRRYTQVGIQRYTPHVAAHYYHTTTPRRIRTTVPAPTAGTRTFTACGVHCTALLSSSRSHMKCSYEGRGMPLLASCASFCQEEEEAFCLDWRRKGRRWAELRRGREALGRGDMGLGNRRGFHHQPSPLSHIWEKKHAEAEKPGRRN